MEYFPVHEEAVNVKPSHTHPFAFSWLFPSFTLLFYFFSVPEQGVSRD